MFATALRTALKTYDRATLRHDIAAAFVVTLVALPLSMALSIAVGLPPQHGLYTAIIAGIIAPLLGGSATQVSGPTAAFVVILAPIVSHYGLRGIIWCSILAGFILILLGLSKLGKLIRFIPYPVTTGFTAGIAIVLGFLSLNDLLGLGLHLPTEGFLPKASLILTHLSATHWPTLGVGLLTLALLIYGGRLIPHIPSPMIAVVAATLATLYLDTQGIMIPTIASKFHYLTAEGISLPGIPSTPPHFALPFFSDDPLYALPSTEELRTWLFPAFTIAILAALESLLSATVADSMAGTRHDPHAEVGAIGIANIACALGGGIPATGAIARTATAINNGAKTPIACVLHAVFILISMLFIAPYLGHIPMSALAAILLYTAYRMSHWHQCVHILQIAPRADRIVLLACLILTVLIDMVAGVAVGLLCACLLLIQQMTELTSFQLEEGGQEDAEDAANAALTSSLPADTLVYRLQGPLFFGSVEKAFESNALSREHIRHLILDMHHVPFIDMSALVAIRSMLSTLAARHCHVSIITRNTAIRDTIARGLTPPPSAQTVSFHESMTEALQHTAH